MPHSDRLRSRVLEAATVHSRNSSRSAYGTPSNSHSTIIGSGTATAV
ncbi:Uncharacterised protein [Mycobacteroides abscessus subsp. abscessus]|nr:Uncharacterised protein [Mycobacteroides abscessus subsp. abscessus]